MDLKDNRLTKKRSEMSFHSNQGKQYLGLLMKSLQSGTGKAKALPYAVNYTKELSLSPNKVPTICEMGCGNGIVIEELRKILESIGLNKSTNFIGLDYNKDLIQIAKESYPEIRFAVADIINGDLQKYEGRFDIVLLVNVLHEVFSFSARDDSGEIDFAKGKSIVKDTIANIKKTLTPEGLIIIVDGIDVNLDPETKVRFKVKNNAALQDFEKFRDTYTIIPADYKEIDKNTFETNIRLFTRMITKSRFIDSSTWDMEKEESHEYYSLEEYRKVLKELGLKVESVDLLGPSLGKWKKNYEILTKGIEYPYEYIILTAKI